MQFNVMVIFKDRMTQKNALTQFILLKNGILLSELLFF